MYYILCVQIREKYGTYYPPRELAVYIPTTLILFFFSVPVIYMGLNMVSAPRSDDIHTIWDTRSTECKFSNASFQGNKESRKSDGCDSKSKCPDCASDHVPSEVDECFSVPSICDLDVRLVNRYVHKQLKN